MSYVRRVKTASGAIAVQVVDKLHGRITRIRHIGSAHTNAALYLLLARARKQLTTPGQLSLLPDTSNQMQPTMLLRRSYSRLLYQVLENQYVQLGFDTLHDTHFKYLCVARIVEPVSKLDSLRVMADIGVDGVGKDMLYRALQRTIKKNYRATIAACCYSHAAAHGISLILYDVTTLYFEIQKEDDYRRPGMSKERRLEPQIIVGLLVDQHGFPMGLSSFEGNTAETTTIIPIMESLKAAHKIAVPVTVVADAGMLSAENLDALAERGYHYIVGSRMHKIPYDIARFQKTGRSLTDGQIITMPLSDRRVIYQYKESRARLDRQNIEKQIKKATAVVEGKTTAKRMKFLTLQNKSTSLNQPLIDKAKALAGIKGYVTNLNVPDREVIAHYHRLFQVEASFRMCKSDLKARPIFHHKRDAIEAHLTIVFAALAIGREIERKTGMSIKQVVKMLKPVRTGIVLIGNTEYEASEEIDYEIQLLLDKLQ